MKAAMQKGYFTSRDSAEGGKLKTLEMQFCVLWNDNLVFQRYTATLIEQEIGFIYYGSAVSLPEEIRGPCFHGSRPVTFAATDRIHKDAFKSFHP